MVSVQILCLFKILKILCQSNSMFVRHSVSSYRRSPAYFSPPPPPLFPGGRHIEFSPGEGRGRRGGEGPLSISLFFSRCTIIRCAEQGGKDRKEAVLGIRRPRFAKQIFSSFLSLQIQGWFLKKCARSPKRSCLIFGGKESGTKYKIGAAIIIAQRKKGTIYFILRGGKPT